MINTSTSTYSADVVAVLRQDNFGQVFPLARPMKATVKVSKKAMEHPVEDGATITDHAIILPAEIELPLVLASEDYRSVYEAIRTLFTESTLLIVQTRTASYRSVIITDMPHEESPDMLDAVPVALRLKEVKLVKAQYGTLPRSKVANAAQSSTVKRGEQSGTEGANSRASVLYGAWKG